MLLMRMKITTTNYEGDPLLPWLSRRCSDYARGLRIKKILKILFNPRLDYKSDIEEQSTRPSRPSKDTNTFSVTRAATLTSTHLASRTDVQCIKVWVRQSKAS